MKSEILYSARGLALRLLSPLLRIRRRRYLNTPTVTFDHIPEMDPQPLEGYTDRYFYTPGQEITFFLKSEFEQNQLLIQRITAPYQYQTIFKAIFPKSSQKQSADPATEGLHWQPTMQIPVPQDWQPGYYRAELKSNNHTSYITFLIGSATPAAPVAILAPVSTWTAYNPYGGKSLYKNVKEQKSVYEVHTQRPNTALQYKRTGSIHDVNIEANIYNWFAANGGADLFPDYVLEQNPELLKSYKVLVLSYHMEYVSEKMYANLQYLVYRKQKSLISLGGNQIYWRTRWHDNFTRLECRKDASDFAGTHTPAGLWRHTSQPEDKMLGVSFTDAGMGTYAPYQVLQPEHWLFKGTGVKTGDFFGKFGINELPICGDETDKTTFFSRTSVEVIAHGLNRSEVADVDHPAVYVPDSSEWNGSGGGDLVFQQLSGHQAILSTGSIQSGSGLGTDTVFSSIIKNFIEKYAQVQ